ELQPSERAQHRASWIQDHLLGVMTGLLALIVLIIAWLLRRANAARDEADAQPRVTEAMVRERIQDIDLDLETGETRPRQRWPGSGGQRPCPPSARTADAAHIGNQSSWDASRSG